MSVRILTISSISVIPSVAVDIDNKSPEQMNCTFLGTWAIIIADMIYPVVRVGISDKSTGSNPEKYMLS